MNATASGFAGRLHVDDREATLQHLERIADMLDSRWRIPGTGWRFGLDAVASVVPVAGSLSTALISAYMIKRAHELGASRGTLVQMVGNVAFDAVVGSIPVVGPVFDLAVKANRRNVRLLRRHLGGHTRY
ncbi:DUF4112 domain-containing protein [Chenggangzhangella methanolivorans]|uniref:DUF4112 domain-containing protein n=1 Tax=Chenggangzhangella methanolivorans TaxID=1437009 RepID=A0A9E6RDV6_9HYPH|nr:DUF4112 domain-containing protein [Chenggangzhangella methanolivorans]QZO01558.1 DUF4112 domain-containing protein [Chenggangzhangella methanolivorans]